MLPKAGPTDVVGSVLDYYRTFTTSANTMYKWVPSSQLYLAGGDCKRKTDIMLSTHHQSSSSRASWNSVRVVGDLKANSNGRIRTLRLCNLPTMCGRSLDPNPAGGWVHAFTLCGIKFRAGIFDRSGCTASTLSEINEDPEIFLRFVCRYAAMDAEEVGFDPTIRWHHSGIETVFDPTIYHQLAIAEEPFIFSRAQTLYPKLVPR